MENQRKLEAMKAVYCYYFPEVRPLVRSVELALPDEMFEVTANADDVNEAIRSLYKPELVIPATPEGWVDLDRVHEPVINRIVKAYSAAVPDLNGFGFVYPTSGSSEGIFHILAGMATHGKREINVFNGEYEGYAAQANNLGMRVNVFDRETDVRKIKPCTWFISNPSAVDGNIVPDDILNDLYASGHEVVLDLAYVGTTRPAVFDVGDERVRYAVMSFSKPYGVFRHRIGGFTFSRNAMPSLYGNKWFKDIKRLFQALKIAEEIGPERLHTRYSGVQSAAITRINEDNNLDISPSDVFLLGYIKDSSCIQYQTDLVSQFRRGKSYRFCLTPYFEKMERGDIR